MSQYQPFLIANMRTGLEENLQPWLLPADAFSEIDNGYIYRGVLNKRQGYQKLASFPHQQTTIADVTTGATTSIEVASATGLSNGQEIQITGTVGVSGVDGGPYLISSLSGATFNITDLEGNAIVSTGTYTSGGNVSIYPGNAIVGLISYIQGDGTKQLLAMDTERAAYFDDSLELFVPIGTSDIFTGTNSAYFWGWNFKKSTALTTTSLYITNNTDSIYEWDGSTLSAFTSTYDGSNTIETCRFIFTLKQRLVFLSTQEDGTRYAQRARWSAADDPGNWDQTVAGGGGFVDAPTAEFILAAYTLQDIVVVWFSDSVWTLRPTSDPALPFRWDRINQTKTVEAPFSSVGYDRFITAIGQPGIFATDSVEVKRIDDKIPDFGLSVLQEEMHRIYGARLRRLNQSWFSYPSLESADGRNDKVLVYNDQDLSWSQYSMPFTVFGKLDSFDDPAWQDFDEETWLTFNDETWASNAFQVGYPLFVGGDYSGVVYQLNDGLSDNGTAIPFSMKSARWNPFKEQGVKCQMGYVDFLVSSDPGTEITVTLYFDHETSPYNTEKFRLLGEDFLIGEVQNVTLTNPVTVTVNEHGLQTGDTVWIYALMGTTELNDQAFTVTVNNANVFSLDGIDGTSYTAYTGGGVVLPNQVTNNKVWKRVYAGAIGYAHRIKIENAQTNAAIEIHAIRPWFKPVKGREIQ